LFLSRLVLGFYVTRLCFRVFSGPEQVENLHEGHVSMVAPMVFLAAGTLVLGFASPRFAEFLGHEGEWPALSIAAVSTVVALIGIGLGWWVYGRRSVVVNTRAYKQRMGLTYGALTQKLYFDTVYEVVFIKPFMLTAEALAWFDRIIIDGVVNGVARGFVLLTSASWKFDGSIIDGAVNGVGALSRAAGGRLRGLQTGRLQSYQRLVLAAVVVFMLYLVVKGA